MKPDWKKETGESFEAHAEGFLTTIYPWLLKDLEIAFGNSLQNLTLLEIGCGPGFMNEYFAKSGCKSIIELDLSHSMLKKASSRGEIDHSIYIQADAAALPLAGNSVDIVFSRGSIFFWDNIGKCFAEISRILKIGGMALIGGGYGISTPQELLLPVLNRPKSGSSRKPIPRLDLDELVSIAKKNFANVQIVQAPKRGFWLKCFAEKRSPS